jgi:hypothetical protein
VVVGLSTAATGVVSGTDVLGFTSHDGVLTDLAINGGTITVMGTVDNYAVAQVVQQGGVGTVTPTSSGDTINLGSVAQSGTALAIDLGVLNAATGTADQLGGSFAISGSAAFTNTGFGTPFTGIAEGNQDSGLVVSLATGTAGVFTETITLTPTSINTSSTTTLTAQTITVTGTIVSSGTTYTLTPAPVTITGTTGNDTLDATSNTLNSHDSIDLGAGTNTLALIGGGYFDLGAPRTLNDIQIVTAQESTGGTTVYMRNSLNTTLNVVPAGTGSLTIYGATDSTTYNLGAGSDTVVAGAATETVNAGTGTALVQATVGFAGVLVNGGSSPVGSTVLELTTGGTGTLNAADTDLTVKLDAATNLMLGGMTLITVYGSAAGHETITAGGTGQTLISQGGHDTLVGWTGFGDIFEGSSTGLLGDVIKNFGGSDTLDLTNVTAATSLTYAAGTGQGVLTVSDGTHSAAVTMSGSYTKASFEPLGSDGHGGTLIGFV